MSSNLRIFVIFSLIVVAFASKNPTISSDSLKKVFEGVKPYSDLSSAFYSVKGLSLLGENLAGQSLNDVCNFVKSKVDKNNIESVYYALSLASSIPNCVLPTTDFQATINNAASSQNIPDLYYYSLIAQLLKSPIDSKKLSKSVQDGLKADSSILNQAYSLHIASLLTENQKQFYDSIEDILDQADEVDKKFLQYEGGVGTTGLVLEGIFELSSKQKQFPAKFDQQKLTKFVNYLTSKRFPTNIKSAYFLLRISLKLSDNEFNIPVILNRLSPVSVSASQPNLLVSLTNILGKPIKQVQFNVEADSAKSAKAALLSGKKAFASKSSDGSTFGLSLVEQNQQPAADFYTVALSVSPKAPANADKRFFLVQNKVEVKVTTLANVVDVQIGVADRDQSAPKLTKVDDNTKLKDKLEADQQSKFYLKFLIKEKAKGTFMEAHQTFVRFSHSKSGREIVFLAQAALSGQYSAEVDFGTNAKNFRNTNGLYSVELIVADSLIENPVAWKIADINLQFIEDQSALSAAQERANLFSKKPEIKHLFRQADPTPPAAVSSLFTLLSLAPLVLLLILWLSIGVNFSKFSFSLSGIVFHVALASIFGLFYCYWVQLNMFQTVRWLALLGAIAFFSGNQLLRHLAKEKKN